MPDQTPINDTVETFELLLTAEEGFVAFEHLILDAKDSVKGCFRVFDLRTQLRGERARAVGDTWFDLLLDALNRGVSLDLTVSDFDPVIATDDHRRSWLSARQFAALNELSTGAKIRWAIAMHPARVGLVARTVLQVKSRPEMDKRTADKLTPGLEDRKGRLDLPLVPTTHHQKLAVVDRSKLYIGGLDLNERRYDTKRHEQPADQTWMDIQAVVTGPVVEAALRHLDSFQATAEGDRPATAAAPGFLRTLSTKRAVELFHLGPRDNVDEIERVHLEAVKATEGPIYLETQFFRHKPLAHAIAEAAAARDGLTCTLILPAAPEDVAFEGNSGEDAQFGAQLQMECIDLLADALGKRLVLASPARPAVAAPDTPPYGTLFDAPIIYVHSKLSLFGMHEGVLSSANLNGRSMKWDTEAGIHLTDPEHLRTCWSRVLAHWVGPVAIDPLKDQVAYASWLNGELARNMVTAPEDRPHFLLPYPRGRDAELAAPLPGVPDKMV